jgi:hypothetical protein
LVIPFYHFFKPISGFVNYREKDGKLSKALNSMIRLAEGAGFEPAVLQRRTTVFKTVTIGHSDTPPRTCGLCILYRGGGENAMIFDLSRRSSVGESDSRVVD